MRRRNDREFSPRTQNTRDRSAYTDRRRSVSPRKPHSTRYKSSKYPNSSRHSPRSKNVSDRRQRDCSPATTRTLCVRNFSSKLNSEVVQEYLFREFDKFGEFSVTVGRLDGERAAILNFKYPEDAREALYAKPSIHLHDRNVIVEALSDSNDDVDTRKFPTIKSRRDEMNNELEMQSDRRHISHPGTTKLEPNFTNFLNKSPGLGPSGTASLLGMPGIASTAMMAAAARALGLNAVPTSLPPPPQLNITGSHGRLGQHAATSRNYDQNRNNYSPIISDTDQDSKATRTLFVGSLEPDITEAEVLKAFERYGYVEQVDIKRSPKAGVHSYAFVRYQNVDMACRAKLSMSGRCIRSLHCKIGYGKPLISQCLYISGLESWMGPEALQRLFSPFGQLIHMDWSAGRKYALAMFENCDMAMEMSRKLKNLPISGRSSQKLRIDFVNPDTARPKMHTVQGELESDMVVEDTIRNQSLLPRTTNVGIRTGYGAGFGISTNHPIDPTPLRHTESSGTYSGRHFVSDLPMVDKNSFHNRQSHMIGKTSYRIADRRHPAARNRHSESQSLLSPVEHGPHSLQTAVYLKELDACLQPDLWKGIFQLKNSSFSFRCLLVIGDAEVGQQLGDCTENTESESKPKLRIARRGKLDAVWMAEATHRVHNVLSTSDTGLCLMLVLPDTEQRSKSNEMGQDERNHPSENFYPLQILIAYLKLKQAAGLVIPCSSHVAKADDKSGDETPFLIYLFAPSSFALSLLKQAAPQLSSDLAATSDYMVLLAIKR